MIQQIQIKRDASLKKKNPDTLTPSTCKEFHALNRWQIEQYRKAVDENKWYMNEQSEGTVDWQEAEYDFLLNGYYGCAQKWRKEYCSNRCRFISSCELGRKFCVA